MIFCYTAENFTAWGYQDCQIPTDDDSYGGMLTKLLMRHLPEYYPSGSAYTHFPFMVPDAMKEAMENRKGPVEKYTWMRPGEKAVDVVMPQLSEKDVIGEVGDVQRVPVKKLTGVDVEREPVSRALGTVYVILLNDYACLGGEPCASGEHL